MFYFCPTITLMEQPIRSRSVRVATAGLLMTLAGCSSIKENNDIAECGTPDGAMIEATTNSRTENYSEATDPVILAAVQREQVDEEIEAANEGWDNTQIAQYVIGIGEIACIGQDESLYLTTEGVKISREYQAD